MMSRRDWHRRRAEREFGVSRVCRSGAGPLGYNAVRRCRLPASRHAARGRRAGRRILGLRFPR